MHCRLVIALLVGLAASSYALDLSHAHKRSIEAEPRLFGILNDFYALVVYPPLNHVVTSMALLGAQVLAGISQTGIPAPGGRTLHPSEAQLRGFFDDLWNNAMRPTLENALSGLALTAAQLLANAGVNGVNLSGIGKRDLAELAGREEELRGFFDTLGQSLVNGLQTVWTNVIQDPLQGALQTTALLAAQVLAGIGVNGVDLSAIGKRDLTEVEARFFLDALADAFNTVFTNVIQKPVEDALSAGALLLAQVLAGVGVNGVDLSGLIGKRDLTEFAGREEELRGFFDTLGQSLVNGLQTVWTNVIQDPLQGALQTTALLAAQVLAGIGVNGVDLSAIGKREARGEILNQLGAHAINLFHEQVKPTVEGALNNVILNLAGVLANFSQNGFGRR